ncbi:uncharacterized protein LOC128962534 [Oppia nitens]|uniref:uncharacterized protein LOC128962534 n=1 Tax=Oppia nitens TaxID=1686743 RepID=UPI0023DB0260|nr:uncharacterized protein LOC128962534 [Oppia nitens]
MCGIGRQSLLANGKCFQWLSQSSLTPSELNNGRNPGPGEVPFAVWIVYTDNKPISNIKIYPGKVFINDDQYPDDDHNGYTIEKTVIHWMFPRRRAEYVDIGLIKLTVDLPLSSQLSTNGHNYRTLLNGICLPPLDALNSEDELALMAGYGSVRDEEESDRLKIGYIRIKKTFNNNTDYWRQIILGERYPSYNGTFSCAGDSGAPLYQYVNGRAVLIGINTGRTISTHKCHEIDDRVRVMFVRVSWFVDWIIDIINKN